MPNLLDVLLNVGTLGQYGVFTGAKRQKEYEYQQEAEKRRMLIEQAKKEEEQQKLTNLFTALQRQQSVGANEEWVVPETIPQEELGNYQKPALLPGESVDDIEYQRMAPAKTLNFLDLEKAKELQVRKIPKVSDPAKKIKDDLWEQWMKARIKNQNIKNTPQYIKASFLKQEVDELEDIAENSQGAWSEAVVGQAKEQRINKLKELKDLTDQFTGITTSPSLTATTETIPATGVRKLTESLGISKPREELQVKPEKANRTIVNQYTPQEESLITQGMRQRKKNGENYSREEIITYLKSKGKIK